MTARSPFNLANRSPETPPVVSYPMRDPVFAAFARAMGWDDPTADKVVEPDAMLAAMGGVALTDGANIAVNLATGVFFTVTLGGNRTIDNPTNHKVGRTVYFQVTQDGTGSRTASWSSHYDFGQDSAPTLSTAAGTVDVLAFFVRSTSKLVYLGIRKDV